MEQPLVSVRVVTYNHEAYIAQCIEGILMQRTDFSFEVIIGEDCSTDRTREIVLAYQEKYPHQIRVITSDTNVGGMKNAIRVQQACQGKYHAMCEGDDYWIDPLKLQKQVNLMETRQDVSLCFHNVMILNESKTFIRLYYETPFSETVDFGEACRIAVPMASVMARSEILATLPAWRENIRFSDILFRLWCAHHGMFGYLNEIMSVYRRHAGGISSTLKPDLAARHAEITSIYCQFDRETQYEHTALIQARIRDVQHLHERERMGWVYFLLHPHHLAPRLRKYLNLIVSEKQMW